MAGASLLSRLCDLHMLIQAMRVHMDKRKFLKNAVYLQVRCWLGRGRPCLAQANMSLWPSHQEPDRPGGRVMSQNRTDTAVVESCAYALGNLSFECELNISFIVACRGAEELVGVLAAFPIAGDDRCSAQAQAANSTPVFSAITQARCWR